jgi:hypothetical protein
MNEEARYLMKKIDADVVKIMSLTQKKYKMYKRDPVKNVIIVSSNNHQDILQDIVYFLNYKCPSWFRDITSDQLSESARFSKALSILSNFLKYDAPRVNDLINDPAEDVFFTENNTDYFNLFQNTELLVNPPTTEKNWDVIHDLLLNLCGNNPEVYDWVFNWLSVLYQYPTYRFSTSVIFIGAHGSGKGMFANALAHIFDNTCYRANSRDLISNFNHQLFVGKFLVLCNEIVDQKNTYQFSNDLKEIVTEKQISVEQKYSDRYLAKNYIKLIMFSNDNNPIYIEKGDRRYIVAKSKKLDMPYDVRNRYWEDESFFKDQVEGFCYALNNNIVDLERVTSEPPMTSAKEDIINYFATDFSAAIREIIEECVDNWVKNIRGEYYLDYSIIYDKYSRVAFKKIHNKKFGSKLRGEGYIIDKVTIDSNTVVRVKIPDEIYCDLKPHEFGKLPRIAPTTSDSCDPEIIESKEYALDELCAATNNLGLNEDEKVAVMKRLKRDGIVYEKSSGVYKFVSENVPSNTKNLKKEDCDVTYI